MGQHDRAGCAARRPLCDVCRRSFVDLRSDAARQYRTRRLHRAGRLSGAGRERRARDKSAALHRLRHPSDGRHRLCLATTAAQPHIGRRRVAAPAGDVRPVRDHPERTARTVQCRQPKAPGRCHRGCELASRRRSVHWSFAAGTIRRGDRRHRRPAGDVLPYSVRPRVPCDVRRPGCRPTDGARQPSCFCARHGVVTGNRGDCRSFARRARQFRSGDRSRAPNFRLRGGDHRRTLEISGARSRAESSSAPRRRSARRSIPAGRYSPVTSPS